MKKLLLVLTYLFLLHPLYAQIGSDRTPLYCGNDEILARILHEDPYTAQRISDQNALMQNAINNFNPATSFEATIPVVVHIVIDPSNPLTNISDQQVIDQIAALNTEFNVANSANIHFCLAQVLPDQTTNWIPMNGTGTAGITRTTDADISFHSSDYEQGLLNSVAVSFDPARYLNIWVVENIIGMVPNILGYAPKPIIPNSMLDGVVIRYDVFGDNTFCSCYNLFGTYQEGKVLVHEVGHYLGVYHPFQRGIFNTDPVCQNINCGSSDGDLCCDTPPCWNTTAGWNGATFGCPSTNMNSCASTNADDNYMEYTDDGCKSVFTADQTIRMQVTLLTLRPKLISAENLVYTGIGPQCGPLSATLVPDFYIPQTQVCTNGTLTYTPVSAGNTAIGFSWSFPGGSPSTSASSSAVTVTYNSSGIFTSTLTVTDGTNSASYTQTVYVAGCTVGDPTQSSWYFGDHASLHFTTSSIPTSPVPPPSAMFSREGCASLASGSSAPLFYTNGQEAYETTGHTQMSGGNMNGSPNSTGLPNKVSGAQTTISFPDPANPNHYYVFTTSDIGATQNQLSYSIIDITSNTIISLNNLVGSSGQETTEHLTAIPDCNDQGYWVITHGINGSYNDKLLAYHVTASGVNNTPVVSNSYTVTIPNSAQSIGQLDVSRDGTRIALTTNTSVTQLYNFDKQTGVCTLAGTLPNNASLYTACFSPNGTFLYTLGAGNSAAELLQWDLSPWHCSTNFTYEKIADYGIYTYFNSLQLGPDGKIYMTTNGDNRLSVINFPDQPGLLCGYNAGGLSMVQQIPFNGLPNMVDALHTPTPIIFFCPSSCNSFTFYSSGCGTTYSWDFGDGIGTSSAVTPSYSYTATGTYTVTLTIDGNPVTPVVVNATGAPALFSLQANLSTNTRELVRLDPVTGTTQQVVAQFPNLIGAISGCSTYDQNHNRFIFAGTEGASSSSPGLNHFVVDVASGVTVMTAIPPNLPPSEYEYDAATNRLYCIVANQATSTRTFSEIDEMTGAVLQNICTIPTNINIWTASSSYNTASGRYIFKGQNSSTGTVTHYYITVSTGAITANAASTIVSEYEYNDQNARLFGLVGSTPTTIDDFSSTSGASISTIATLTGVTNTILGCTTIDFDANRYIFFGATSNGTRHIVVDCSTGSVSQYALTYPQSEYEYASCAPSCPTCRYARPHEEAQANAPMQEFTEYPNPADQQTTFSYNLSQDGVVSLEIFDMTGKLISTPLQKATQQAGEHHLEWNTGNLAPGIYYCRLTTAAGQANSKMIITR